MERLQCRKLKAQIFTWPLCYDMDSEMQGCNQWSDDTLQDTADIIEPRQNLAKPLKQNDHVHVAAVT